MLATMALPEKLQANERFRQAMQMWDGMGFKDRVVEEQHLYATYKLALALLAAKKVSERPSAHEAILERLLGQQSEDGGWITDYDRHGKPVGVANVETTSLAVLALDAVV
jgi:hypothetical protein